MPRTMHSFVSFAYSRSDDERLILPALSNSDSWAGAIIRRWIIRARDWNSDVESIRLPAIRFHSGSGNTHRHWSIPRVTTRPDPFRSTRTFEGMRTLPFSSSDARYSPVITLYSTISLNFPLFPTILHILTHADLLSTSGIYNMFMFARFFWRLRQHVFSTSAITGI